LEAEKRREKSRSQSLCRVLRKPITQAVKEKPPPGSFSHKTIYISVFVRYRQSHFFNLLSFLNEKRKLMRPPCCVCTCVRVPQICNQTDRFNHNFVSVLRYWKPPPSVPPAYFQQPAIKLVGAPSSVVGVLSPGKLRISNAAIYHAL